MVAFVEHNALQHGGFDIAAPAPRQPRPVKGRLGENQSVIGDDQISPA